MCAYDSIVHCHRSRPASARVPTSTIIVSLNNHEKQFPTGGSLFVIFFWLSSGVFSTVFSPLNWLNDSVQHSLRELIRNFFVRENEEFQMSKEMLTYLCLQWYLFTIILALKLYKFILHTFLEIIYNNDTDVFPRVIKLLSDKIYRSIWNANTQCPGQCRLNYGSFIPYIRSNQIFVSPTAVL